MDEANAEKAEEVDEGCDEGEERGHLGERDDVERGRVSDLLAPPVEEEVRHREEHAEEHPVRYEQRHHGGHQRLWGWSWWLLFEGFAGGG